MQEEEHSVTELQTKAQPNKAILSKLRQEMAKLYAAQVSYVCWMMHPIIYNNCVNYLAEFILSQCGNNALLK